MSMMLPTLDHLKKTIALIFNIPDLKTPENESNFLHYLLSKISINPQLINNVEWRWLETYIPDLYQALRKKEKDDRNKITTLAYDLFKPIYTKYSFLFQSTPVEFLELTTPVNADYAQKVTMGSLASILLKLDGGYDLSEDEIAHLKINRLNEKEFKSLSNFLALKKKYNALNYAAVNPKDNLYSILQKLDSDTSLTPKDINFLNHHHLHEALSIYQVKLDAKRQDFTMLKAKYSIQDYDDTNPSSLLYKILQKFESSQGLEQAEISWLKTQGLETVVDLEHFLKLKIKYAASSHADISLHSHLYKVLKKIDEGIPLAESDLNFLKKRQLLETVNLAFDRYCQILIQQISRGEDLTDVQRHWIETYNKNEVLEQGKIARFNSLLTQYEVLLKRRPKDEDSLEENLYLILNKLDKGIRLDAIDLAYLQEHGLFFKGTQLYITYHRLEAQFDEQDYSAHKNAWKIPSISSNWRKAEEPQKALDFTQSINLESIKEKKLKAAILTTQGGSWRDLETLHKAESCAMKAIDLQPHNHHPYTLMGAICYDRHNYLEGDRWFEKAIERGASLQSIDGEIEKALKRTTDRQKLQDMIHYLLKKDPIRYDWVQKYNQKKHNPNHVKKRHSSPK